MVVRAGEYDLKVIHSDYKEQPRILDYNVLISKVYQKEILAKKLDCLIKDEQHKRESQK